MDDDDPRLRGHWFLSLSAEEAAGQPFGATIGRAIFMLSNPCTAKIVACTAFAITFSINPIQATTVIGSSVTGGLFFANPAINQFDPVNGNVPAGFSNYTSGVPTVTVAEPA